MSELHGTEPVSVPSDDSRRVYVHTDSFRELASGSTGLAFDVCMALTSMRVTRTIETNVEQVAQDLGIFTESDAETVMAWHVEQRDLLMGGLLRACGFVQKIPYERGPIQQVLGNTEIIDRSCFADGYYTIAFRGEDQEPWRLKMSDAADRMYRDNDRIPELTRSLADHGTPSDLKIIRGSNLLYLKSLTLEQRQHRSSYRRHTDPLPGAKLSKIDEQCKVVYAEQALEKLEAGWLHAMMRHNYSRAQPAMGRLDRARAGMLAKVSQAVSVSMQYQSLNPLEKQVK